MPSAQRLKLIARLFQRMAEVVALLMLLVYSLRWQGLRYVFLPRGILPGGLLRGEGVAMAYRIGIRREDMYKWERRAPLIP